MDVTHTAPGPPLEAAPPPTGARRVGPTFQEGTTTRPMWWAAYAAYLLVIAVRLPTVFGGLRERIPDDVVAQIGDEASLQLALRVGTLLALLVVPVVMGLIFWVAATFERNLLPQAVSLPAGQRIGLYYCVLVATLIPQHVVAAVIGAEGQQRGPVFLLVMAGVVVGVWLVFRDALRALPAQRLVLVLVTSVVTAAVVTVG